jgi:uncharacterized phage protein (TIGR01671 family)
MGAGLPVPFLFLNDMREIRFRAWDKRNEKFLIGKESPIIFFDGNISFPEGGWDINGSIASPDELGVVIEQFTGLHDKDKVDAYEGDIVEFRWLSKTEGKDKTALGGIVFFDGSFLIDRIDGLDGMWHIHRGANGVCDFKVIGNIHENPELLK